VSREKGEKRRGNKEERKGKKTTTAATTKSHMLNKLTAAESSLSELLLCLMFFNGYLSRSHRPLMHACSYSNGLEKEMEKSGK